MNIDVMGIYGACSYALDCVEAELVHVTNKHAKRVTYMSVCLAETMGFQGDSLQDLAACALLHDNALTQYIKEELHNDLTISSDPLKTSQLGIHCSIGEKNITTLPFLTDVKNVILYHHETADGRGPFGKTWLEVPVFSRIIHLCDLLDCFCQVQTFTHDTWLKANDFLSKNRGSIVDEECCSAFLHSFPVEHFLSLGNDDLEQRLWEKIPRIKQDLDFSQIQALADFFAGIVDYKSPFTSTHSSGVAKAAFKLSWFMGLGEEIPEKMYLAGALHDIGKIAIGNEILEKPGRLTEEEYSVMKHHAAYTYYILSAIDDFEEIRDWAAFHHERLDGTGYPFHKSAEDLNTQERIMACVDIYQALTENRPYKKGMSHEKAYDILKNMADKGWIDPVIVNQLNICFSCM